jgi:hypothetical protein
MIIRTLYPTGSEINRDILQRVWAETDYRLNVCHVTKGGHREPLRGTQRNLENFSFHL